MNTPLPLLELRDVAKTFRPEVFEKPIHPLQGISLKFPQGLCTGIVGHNGAGKTTTIRLILGLIRPTRGEILFRGTPMTRNSRASIGYMAEAARFPTGLTCYDILMTHLALYKVGTHATRRELVLQTLTNVGLGHAVNRTSKQLSKGMAQRLAWAQATIHQPDLLILDEPFSGLDPLGRITMKNWILAEKKRGMTMILCTHELPQIISLCDHINILRKGRLVYSNVPEATDQNAVHDTKNLPRYYVDLSGVTPDQLTQIRSERKLPAWTTLHQEGFLVRLGFPDYPAASAWLAPAMAQGWVIVRFGDDNSATEEQLLVHFREEFTQ